MSPAERRTDTEQPRTLTVTIRWDPAHAATFIAVGLIVSGFAVMGLAWRGLAATLMVAVQLPYAISGGVAGVGMVGAGAALLSVQSSRALTARRCRDFDVLIEGALDVLAALRPPGEDVDQLRGGSISSDSDRPSGTDKPSRTSGSSQTAGYR